ncbi:hypothetical protein C8R44DRAFT_790813 [Mycena epipterygia]|nr:hypothetical protein C8R44DRAFT_790813 [Mycena epipterygia]
MVARPTALISTLEHRHSDSERSDGQCRGRRVDSSAYALAESHVLRYDQLAISSRRLRPQGDLVRHAFR